MTAPPVDSCGLGRWLGAEPGVTSSAANGEKWLWLPLADGKLVMYRLTPLGVHLTAAALASIGLRSVAVTKVKSLPLTTASALPMPADNGCDCWAVRDVPAVADVRGV